MQKLWHILPIFMCQQLELYINSSQFFYSMQPCNMVVYIDKKNIFIFFFFFDDKKSPYLLAINYKYLLEKIINVWRLISMAILLWCYYHRS